MRTKISFGKFNWHRSLTRNQITGAFIVILIFSHAISLVGQGNESGIDQYVNARFKQPANNEALYQKLDLGLNPAPKRLFVI
jgi:hypothetical protein